MKSNIIEAVIRLLEKAVKMLRQALVKQPKPRLSANAKRKALALWSKYRFVAGVGRKGRMASHADVFWHCRRELAKDGINDSSAFKKAIKAEQTAERRRKQKEQEAKSDKVCQVANS